MWNPTIKILFLFIDAVNENCEPMELIKNIQALVSGGIDSMKKIKVFASCRAESWSMFWQNMGRGKAILNEDFFYTKDGDAIALERFNDKTKESLYKQYQMHYNLSPEGYEDLDDSVKELIGLPLMMSMVAQVYKNEQKGGSKEIPHRLNFYQLFMLLEKEKLADAKRLLSYNSYTGVDYFVSIFGEGLYNFTSWIYDNLMNLEVSLRSGTGVDAVPAKRMMNEPLLVFDKKKSIYDIFFEIGLLKRIECRSSLYFADRRVGYNFFHDEYTQFRLSQFYCNFLGEISTAELESNKEHLDRTSDEIIRIIDNPRKSLVVTYALDHYLYHNMKDREVDNDQISDYLIVLFNEITKSESGQVQYYVGRFIHGLIEKNICKPNLLYEEIFTSGNESFKNCVVSYIVHISSNISKENFRALLAACSNKSENQENDRVQTHLADIYADKFIADHTQTVKLLEDFILKEDVHAILNASKEGSHDRVKNTTSATVGVPGNAIKTMNDQIAFIVKFSVKVVISEFDDGEKMDALYKFVEGKYPQILTELLGKQNSDKAPQSARSKGVLENFIYGFYRKKVANKLPSALEKAGIVQWRNAISATQCNNLFFVKNFGCKGIVQRDELFGYFKYMVHCHNREWECFTIGFK